MKLYAYVQLLSGFNRPFLYAVSAALAEHIAIGTIVVVPLKDKLVGAVVTSIHHQLPEKISYQLKEIAAIEPMPDDPLYQKFVKTVAAYAFVSTLHFSGRIKSFLHEQKTADAKDSPSILPSMLTENVQLTDQQQAVVDYLEPFINQSAYAPTVIHGVTGSGKTEVYKKLITQALSLGKSAILMLPEVSLAVQFEHRLRKQLPGVLIFGFHSATNVTAKRELWQALLDHRPMLVIGVHLPIMLPMHKLGVIIIDEEHEQGFVEKKHPKLNSKELALWRAKIYGIPIVLGSATPSVNTLFQVENQGWKLFQITQRFAGKFPEVKKVLLTEQDRRRKYFWVSKELEQAVNQTLARKEQVIIYINRRGFSFFVQCKLCGFIFQCPHCSVSLTLHMTTKPGHEKKSMLCCHYCEYKLVPPNSCTSCKAGSAHLLKKGIGTQQVVEIFQELFPHARIARADLDSTSKKKTWHKTVEQFEQGELDILIGTKSVTKGYHFPFVTLVGILWADLNLHFPAYNAAETTLQQIIQVAGRAGREHEKSTVIVQVLHDHQIFQYVNEERYLEFCKEELAMRQMAKYPPALRLASIELRHKDVVQLEADALAVCDQLQQYNKELKLEVAILGPSLPVVFKIQDYEMRHILLKAQSFGALHKLLQQIDRSAYVSEIFLVTSGE